MPTDTPAQWTTPTERRQSGQAIRKKVPRRLHAEFSAKHRHTSALTLLEQSVKGRVPSLVKLKNERMAASPFGYFRGAVPVMAADLATLPTTGILVQLCGDAHVRNLGAYAAEDGRLIFDINDFDETFRGPFEWDLKRMAASLVLAGRESSGKELLCERAVQRFVESYSERMRVYAPMPIIDVARDQISRFDDVAPVHAALRKAVRSTPLRTLKDLTIPVTSSAGGPAAGKKHPDGQSPDGQSPDGQNPGGQGETARLTAPRRFREQKPVLFHIDDVESAKVLASLHGYRATLQSQRQHLFSLYKPLDVCFKVVGTGSVGLRDYCIYMEGNGSEDPLFLQVKEEAQSAYAPYLKDPDVPRHQGQRVVEGQRLIQTGTDILLGYTTIDGRDYLVRRLSDHKASIELEDLRGDGLVEYAILCGELLARGHARSGDPRQIAGYLGSGESFVTAIVEFGRRYADQTEKDWAELKKAKQ
jgi:uncharacterized protein (DUF2252 family)